MANESLKVFLVSLRYQIDEAGRKRFDGAVSDSTLRVETLEKSLKATGKAIRNMTALASARLRTLSGNTLKPGASASNIDVFSRAVSRVGGDVRTALSSVDGLGEKLRNLPETEAVFGKFGIATRRRNGQLRDTIVLLSELSQSAAFQALPAIQRSAVMQDLGVDDLTYRSLAHPAFTKEADDYQRVLVNLNIDLDDSARKMRDFSANVDRLKSVGQAVMMDLTGTLAGDLNPLLELANDTVLGLSESFASLSPEVRDVAKQIGAAGVGVAALGKALPVLKSTVAAIKDVWNIGKTVGSGLAAASASPLMPLAALAAGSFTADVAMTRKRADSVMEANTGGDYVGLLFGQKKDGGHDSSGKQAEKSVDVTVSAKSRGRTGAIGSDRVERKGRAPTGRAKSAGSTTLLKTVRSDEMTVSGATDRSTTRFAKEVSARIRSAVRAGYRADDGSAEGSSMRQWHPDRKILFRAFFGKDVRPSTVGKQLEFMRHGLMTDEAETGRRLTLATTGVETDGVFSRYTERAAVTDRVTMSRGETTSHFNQTVNITVHGAVSPQETADAVKQSFLDIDVETGLRNMKSPVMA